jgi:hypothetical protein
VRRRCQDARPHEGQDCGLGHEQDSEDLRADVDAPVAEEPDGGDGYQGDAGQGTSSPKTSAEHGVGLDGEKSVDADLEAVVGDDRQDGRGQPHRLAHGQRDVGVEAAGCFDVFGHGHEGDGEDQQHGMPAMR